MGKIYAYTTYNFHYDDFLKSNLLDVYDELDNLEKRKIWANLIDRVEIKDSNDIDIIV